MRLMRLTLKRELNWIEKELARRYIVGALLHVNKELRTDVWRDWGTIDASNIFINHLNVLATVYELEPGDDIGIDPVSCCRLCRRETQHPSVDVCLRCTVFEVMTFMAKEKEEKCSFPESHNLVDDLLDTRDSQERDDLRDKR